MFQHVSVLLINGQRVTHCVDRPHFVTHSPADGHRVVSTFCLSLATLSTSAQVFVETCFQFSWVYT